MDKITVLVTGLYFLSEALALIPGIKANSTFQLLFNIVKSLKGKKDGGVDT